MDTTTHTGVATSGTSSAPINQQGYTAPTFCEASQSSVLLNPITGRPLGADWSFNAMLATSCPPPPIFDPRPDTGGPQQTHWLARVARRLAEIFRDLDRISALPDDWDTFGGERATAVALNSARSLVWDVAITAALHTRSVGRISYDVVPYDVAPLSGGGLQLEWRNGPARLQVEVSGEGRFGYFLRHGEETEEADDVPKERLLGLILSTSLT